MSTGAGRGWVTREGRCTLQFMRGNCRCLVIGLLLVVVVGCHRYTVHEVNGESRSVHRQSMGVTSLPKEELEEEASLSDFSQGLLFLEKSEWRSAERQFQKVLSEEGGTVELLDFLGQIAWKTGKIEEARDHFRQAMGYLEEGRFRGDIPNRSKYREQLERRLKAVEMDMELSIEVKRARELDEDR